MLGILLDVAALWLIATFLAKENMADDMMRFVLLAGALLVVGVGVTFSGAPLELALSAWFGTLLLGMRFVIGASWLGAIIGAILFLGYRILLGMVL